MDLNFFHIFPADSVMNVLKVPVPVYYLCHSCSYIFWYFLWHSTYFLPFLFKFTVPSEINVYINTKVLLFSSNVKRKLIFFKCYRMLKHTKLSSGSSSPSSGSRFTLSRRLSHHLSFSQKVPTDKENSSSQQFYNMDFSLMTDAELSPSKVRSKICNRI